MTRQWLSVPARAEASLAALAPGPELRVLSHARHGNKLRVGHLRGNRFRIRIRDAERPEAAGPVMERLVAEGLPNAFGEQRFGRGDTGLRGRALVLGERLPSRPSTFERKLYVSAYQSLLFNRMLEARLGAGTLRSALAGDLMRKTDSGGLFVCQEPEVDQARVERGEIAPTGPMFGWKMQRAGGGGRRGRAGGARRRGTHPRELPAARQHRRGNAAAVLGPGERGALVGRGLDRRARPSRCRAGSYATVLLDEVMKRAVNRRSRPRRASALSGRPTQARPPALTPACRGTARPGARCTRAFPPRTR